MNRAVVWLGFAWACGGSSAAPKATGTPVDDSTVHTDTSDTADTAHGGDSADTEDSADPSVPPVECPPLRFELLQHWPVGHDPLIGGWGAAVADFDGNGHLDVVLANRRGARSLRNTGGSLSPGPLLIDGEPAPPAQAVAAADLDQDGDIDLFLGTPSPEPDLLLWNQGDFTFTATVLPDSGGFTGTGTFADFDGDGRLDLFVARRFEADVSLEEITSTAPAGDPSSLYLQDATARFVDASARLPPEVHPAHTQEAAALDVDSDGDLDLYLANDFGPFVVPNQLLLNDGTGHFTLASDCFCELAMYGMAASVGDIDGDGLPDLWLTDVGGPKLLVNYGDGSFVESALAMGADLGAASDRLVSWGAVVHDFDQNGQSDLFTAFGQLPEIQTESVELLGEGFTWSDDQHDALLLASADGFVDVGSELGLDSPENHRAVVRGDFDNDGRSELFVVGGPTARVWDVTGGCESNLRISLNAGAGNPHGIGARVEVEVGPHRWTGWMLPGGIGSSSELVVEAPLMGAPSADVVRVTWPDGHVSESTDVPEGSLSLVR